MAADFPCRQQKAAVDVRPFNLDREIENLRPVALEHIVVWLTYDKPNLLHTLAVADDSRVILIVLGPP